MARKPDPGTEDRLEQLLAAALAEFARKPYAEASLNRILKDAGISKGVFYHYFADKAALYAALLRRLADAKRQLLSGIGMDVRPQPEEDLFVYLQRALQLNAALAAQDPVLYRFAIRFQLERPEFRRQMQGHVPGAAGLTGALIDHGLATGTFDPAYPPEFVRAAFTYFTDHVFDLMPLEEDVTARAVEERVVLLLRFLRDGLGARESEVRR
jgi:TetR/AcrR family transcriptional regulator